MARFLTGTIAALATIVLTACAGLLPPVSSPSPTEERDSSPTTATATAPAANPGNGADDATQMMAQCIEGLWLLDNTSWGHMVQGHLPDPENNYSLESVHGAVFLSFSGDGSYAAEYRDWTVRLTLAPRDGGVVINREGTDRGAWDVRDGVVHLRSLEAAAEMDAYFESVNGRSELEQVGGVPTAIDDGFTYDCEAPTMVATSDEGTVAFTSES